MSKRVLFITCRVPRLGAKGDQIAAYRKIFALRKAGYHVLVACLTHEKRDAVVDDIRLLREEGINVAVYHLSTASLFKSIVAKSIFGAYPAQVAMYADKKAENFLRDVCASFQPDVQMIVTARAAANVGFRRNVNTTIDFIDSLALNFERRALRHKGIIRELFRLEARRMWIYERELAKKAHCSWIVSDVDRQYLGQNNIISLPVPVNVSSARNRKSHRDPDDRVIFTGNMNYHPNVEAIRWFLRYCWPNILSELPRAEFHVAGRGISRKLKNFIERSPRTVVHGEVQDMTKFISFASVAVAPLLSGSGMQLKILEAMCSAVPVVTTTIGYGGLGVDRKAGIRIADNPDFFARDVVELLKDKILNAEVGNSGFAYVLAAHHVDVINCKFIESMEAALT
jgi:glycosyltransferase involved in cell wall biosynthesis